MYDMNEKDEKLSKLVGERETDYYIFKRIFELAKNSSVAKYERWFDVETDINVKKKQMIALWFIIEINNKIHKKQKSRRIRKFVYDITSI